MTTAILAFRRVPRVPKVALFALVFGLGVLASASGLIDEMLSYRDDIVFLTGQHVELVATAGALAILTAVPLGVVLSRRSVRHVAEGIMQTLNIGTTIPTLAVLALSMTLLGLGFVPAVFGLWLATLLPITRNTYTGLLAVPQPLREAATGMGMTPMQMLMRVELPNALFVIFAGIRTALAVCVGTAPLAFLIGGGGLGELIFTGIDLNDTGMMLAGAIPTALLAITVDFLVGQIQLRLIPRGVNPLR